MRVGVQTGNYGEFTGDPADIPVAITRFQPIDSPPFTKTRELADKLTAAGKHLLMNPFLAPWLSNTEFFQWITAWSEFMPVGTHEFGNEPKPSQWDLYAYRLRMAASILREAGNTVICAAAPTSKTDDFIRFCMKNRLYGEVHGAAVHPYATDAAASVELVKGWQKKLPLPVWVTEVGWSAGKVGEGNQAAYLRGVIRKLAQTPQVRLCSVFCLEDYPAEPYHWWNDAGLIDLAGNKRPSWEAVRTAI